MRISTEINLNQIGKKNEGKPWLLHAVVSYKPQRQAVIVCFPKLQCYPCNKQRLHLKKSL